MRFLWALIVLVLTISFSIYSFIKGDTTTGVLVGIFGVAVALLRVRRGG